MGWYTHLLGTCTHFYGYLEGPNMGKSKNGHQYGQTPPKTDFPDPIIKMEHMGGYLKLLGFSDCGTKLSCKAQAWVQDSTNLSKTTAGFFPHRNSQWKMVLSSKFFGNQSNCRFIHHFSEIVNPLTYPIGTPSTHPQGIMGIQLSAVKRQLVESSWL